MKIVNMLFSICFVIFRQLNYLKIKNNTPYGKHPFGGSATPRRKARMLTPLLITLGLCLATPAASEHVPEGPLRVFLIDGTEQVLAREDLAGMQQTEFLSSSPWTDGIHHYQGVPLLTLVKNLYKDARLVKVGARNDYQVTFEIESLTEAWPILALKMDGEHISPRTKGPYWVVYPYDDYPELQREDIYARSIWLVETLNIE